jgi:hypothetical protein
MNAALAFSVPPAAVIVAEAPAEAVDVDARHQQMIRGSAAMHDMALEDLTLESLSIMEGLVEQFRSDLTRCQAALAVREGGAKGR